MAGRIIRRILFVLVLILMFAVLELNKNIILGWVLTAVLGVGFALVAELVWKKKRFWFKALCWLLFFVCFAGILFLTWPPVKSVPAVSVESPQRTPVLSLADGQIRGVYSADGKVAVYAGIPYAKPPVGDLRWKEPQAPEPWQGVLDCDHFAPMAMQPRNLPIYDSLAQIIGYHDYQIRLDDNHIPPASEDCLYLNVWVPAGGGEKLPVLVYVHGGSLQTGQAWYGDYSGGYLAGQGIIVVNMSYRLGVFGYFADPELQAESPNGTTGNYGLLDQIKALEWVRENVAAFGGDPDNITLAGESAGAASVSAICVSPLAKGLFRRAVLESSTVASAKPPHSFRSLEDALASGAELKQRHGCKNLAELRALSAEDLVSEAETQHHITVEGYALTKTPYESYLAGEFNEEAILHGYNAEESAPFLIFSHASRKDYEKRVRDYFGVYADRILALYPAATDEAAKAAWAEIYGAVFFDYPHYCLNRLENRNNVPTYEYYFSKSNGRLGSWHSGEEIYLYGNIPAESGLFDDADRALSKTMTEYFLNFIRTGNPNGEGLPAWQPNTTGAELLELGDTVGMIKEPRLGLYQILDEMDGFRLE